MMVISRTPVRISLFGGGTDYPDYYLRESGAILGTTIDKYTYISLNILSDFFEHKIRIGYSKTELVKSPNEIEHPSIRECLKFKKVDRNLGIHIFSDLPAKTGLGSSSSFTVGFLNALYALQGKKISKQRLAEEACFIEQQMIRENVGSQDQFHAAFGGFNLMEFTPHSVQVKPVIVNREKRKYLEENIMLFYTGLTRFASEVVKEQIEKTKQKSNDDSLRTMKDMVYQAEDILTRKSSDAMLQDLGLLLKEGWQFKKRLSSQISNIKIDEAYERALSAGAYGGKLCGAGSGGFLLLIASKDTQDFIRKALPDLLEVKFHFDHEGSTIVYMKD